MTSCITFDAARRPRRVISTRSLHCICCVSVVVDFALHLRTITSGGGWFSIVLLIFGFSFALVTYDIQSTVEINIVGTLRSPYYVLGQYKVDNCSLAVMTARSVVLNASPRTGGGRDKFPVGQPHII